MTNLCFLSTLWKVQVVRDAVFGSLPFTGFPRSLCHIVNTFANVHIALTPSRVVLRLSNGERNETFGIDISKSGESVWKPRTIKSMSVSFSATALMA